MKVNMTLRERKIVDYSTYYTDEEECIPTEKIEPPSSPTESDVSIDKEKSSSFSEEGDIDQRRKMKDLPSLRRSSRNIWKAQKHTLDNVSLRTPRSKHSANFNFVASHLADGNEAEEEGGISFKKPSRGLLSLKRKHTSPVGLVSDWQRPRRNVRVNYKEESDSDVGFVDEKKMVRSSDKVNHTKDTLHMVLEQPVSALKSFNDNSLSHQEMAVAGRRRLVKLVDRSSSKVPKKDEHIIEERSVGVDNSIGAQFRFYRRNRKSQTHLGGSSESVLDMEVKTVDKSESASEVGWLERSEIQSFDIENDFLPGEVEYFAITYKRTRKRDKQSCEAFEDPLTQKTKTDSRVIERIEQVGPKLQVGVFGPFEGEGDERLIIKRIGQVDKILSVRNRSNCPVFCVKECGKSYRKAVVVSESTLLKNCPQLMRNFLRRMDELGRIDGNLAEQEDGPAFNPLYIEIDRIIASEQRGRRKYYLVKWRGLSYSEATWEWEDDLAGDKKSIQHFLKYNTKPSRVQPAMSRLKFRDGRVLRDYQEKGLAWLYHNFQHEINCILADEMGLGKTMQSVAMLQNLRIRNKIRGPFLVIAPVSTLGHWQREVESLTDMNCVVYSGSMEDREIIREYDFYYADSKSLDPKFNVLLTSFEILMKDQGFLLKHQWQYIIVDEAHRLKTRYSKTTRTLKQLNVRKGGLLLLTGTPIQNNTKEIFSLLNVLDPENFCSEEEFLLKYGDIKNVEQVKDLQENILKPRLLRRMKEDVEKTIPLKEETIIWVELTREQRSYYRAIYENRIADLLKGSQTNNIPNLRNVAMELRKLCNHPFLCDGLEEDLISKYHVQIGNTKEKEELFHKVLCQSSGKMMLLDKLLPMLKEAGRRVLIFSQFTMMLDLLEDYLNSKGDTYERIDGKIRGSDRQAAIDRYSAQGSDTFVFLLSTRAGGLGITLTAANTCIIYDSDWNPQNDLQAMARCHRIGQTKDVKIYRLITRNTYEQHLFECSSRKYGLDEAILGNMLASSWDHEQNQNIESLLKRGAYAMLKDDGEAEAAAFHAQNIEQILEQRTQKRQIGGRGNNTFSVATFISTQDVDLELIPEGKPELNKDSTTFWHELLPEACNAALTADKLDEVFLSGGRRKRERVNYRENGENSDEGSSEGEDRRPDGRKRPGQRRRTDLDDEEGDKQWSEREVKQLENRLIMLGRGRIEQAMIEAGLQHRSLAEVQAVADALFQMIQQLGEDSTLSLSQDLKLNPFQQTDKFVDIPMKDVTPQLDECVSGILLEKSQIEVQDDMKNTLKLENIEITGDGDVKNAVDLEREDVVTTGGLQAQKNILIGGSRSANMGTCSLKLSDIPSFAQRVMCSQGYLLRLQKHASRYLQILHEREVLAKALSSGEFVPPSLPRTKRLPSWWGEAEDMDLLKGANKHGHKDFSKIRDDDCLRFAARFDAPKAWANGVIILPMGCCQDQVVTESISSDKEDQMDWPHDNVLMGRLKRLIECLPNGLTEREMRRKAAANEYARRRNQEMRAIKLSQEAKNTAYLDFGSTQQLQATTSTSVLAQEPIIVENNLQPLHEVSCNIGSSNFSVSGSNFLMKGHESFVISDGTSVKNLSNVDVSCSNQQPHNPIHDNKQQNCQDSLDICTTLLLQESFIKHQEVPATLPASLGASFVQVTYSSTNSDLPSG